MNCILKILYLILVLFIIYDVFGNFLKVHANTYANIKNKENELKDSNYFKYLFYSRTYPIWVALKQWRVIYPILLFVLPLIFVYFLGEQEVSQLNSFVKDNLVLFILPLALIVYFENKK